MTDTMTVPTYATPVHHATLVLGLELIPDPKMKFLSTMGQVAQVLPGIREVALEEKAVLPLKAPLVWG